MGLNQNPPLTPTVARIQIQIQIIVMTMTMLVHLVRYRGQPWLLQRVTIALIITQRALLS